MCYVTGWLAYRDRKWVVSWPVGITFLVSFTLGLAPSVLYLNIFDFERGFFFVGVDILMALVVVLVALWEQHSYYFPHSFLLV